MTELGAQLEAQWEEWGATDRFVVPVHPEHRHRFHVYIAWGEDRTRPLYVGKSNGFWDRMRTHLRAAKWASEVAEFEVYAFDSEADALEGELEAIQAFDPIFNVRRGLTRRQYQERMAAFEATKIEWQRKRELKAADDKLRRARAQVREAERVAKRKAERIAYETERRTRPPTQTRVQSPWQGRRRRRVIQDYADFPADQLEIIRRVQDRDWQKR